MPAVLHHLFAVGACASSEAVSDTPEEVSLENILELILSEYRHEMSRPGPGLCDGERGALSPVHVLAHRGGLEDSPHDDGYNVFGYGRSSSIGSAEDSESLSRYALIFKGILAWVHLSRSFFLRL